jgi:hypothetical protein
LHAGRSLASAAGIALTLDAPIAVDGGTLSPGALVNNSTLEIRTGSASVAGATTNSAGALLFLERTLSIGGTLTNASGARLELAGGTGRLVGAGVVQNSGLLTGSGAIACATSNNATGKIRAESGKTLYFTGGLTGGNSGEMNLQGGTLDFTLAITNNAGAFITGRGALYTGGLTNNGQMAFSGAGSVTTFFDDVVHNGTEIRTSAGCSTVFFGGVSGAGPYTGTGTVYFEGDLRPGNSPASVLFGGDLALGDSASLIMEIGGMNLGAQYDHLNIGGSLFADGDLVLALLDGFTPQVGATFDLFDVGTFAGDFDSITAPALSGGNAWDFSALKTTGSVTVVPEPGIGALLLSALALFTRRGGFRTARPAIRKSRLLGSAAPAMLPGTSDPALSETH